MNVVITYRHGGDELYYALIRDAFASAKRMGYKTISVGDFSDCDIHMPFVQDMPLMNWILAAQKHYIDSPEFDCNTVLFSPDALINRPLEEVFSQDFDAAFTIRDNKKYPINNGVIFIKPDNKRGLTRFWQSCLDICALYPPEIQGWYGDQKALWDACEAGYDCACGIKKAFLPCDQYNASPVNGRIDKVMLTSAFIIHLKGRRKEMMKQYKAAICR